MRRNVLSGTANERKYTSMKNTYRFDRRIVGSIGLIEMNSQIRENWRSFAVPKNYEYEVYP